MAANGPTSNRPLGFWLKLLDSLIDQQFAASLEEHGLTRRQWQLMNLLHGGAASVDELDAAIAPFLDGEESSTEHLDELVESEWVRLESSRYSLTDRGTESFAKLRVVVEQSREVVAGDVTDAEYRSTLDVLERMARNLGWNG